MTVIGGWGLVRVNLICMLRSSALANNALVAPAGVNRVKEGRVCVGITLPVVSVHYGRTCLVLGELLLVV